MFLRYFDFLFQPFRSARNKFVQAKNIQGNIRVDVNRVKSYKELAKARGKEAKAMAGKARGKVDFGAVPAPGQPGAPRLAMSGGQGPAAGNLAAGPASGYPGPGMAQFQGPQGGASPPIVSRGMAWWKKHFCGSCGQELDRSWDHCPYCAQAAPAPAAMKTQAISLDPAGRGTGHQMLAWLVPLRGPQRGELFTLAPVTAVGTDPSSTVVLIDQYMSARHAEIKAEGGAWILRDLRSTNGTYVNDKRIEQHELVDNDFVRFGQSLVKFKCL